jgi:hypothetical protein
MAFRNNFQVNLFVNNQFPNIEPSGRSFETFLQNECKYSIHLSNYNSELVDAYLKIDGKKMGAYRILPEETIEIQRPFRRKKDLYFLHKKQEYQEQNLFQSGNKKLGCIEVDFRTGILYPKDEEIRGSDYTYNKQAYRLSSYDYKPQYMNIYKRVKSNSLYVLPIETECCSEPEENFDCLSMKMEIGSVTNSESKENFNSIPEEKELGFTVYGEPSKLKYKIYQTLDYDGDNTNLKLYLCAKNNFTSL